jgi:hypothetical protein
MNKKLLQAGILFTTCMILFVGVIFLISIQSIQNYGMPLGIYIYQ